MEPIEPDLREPELKDFEPILGPEEQPEPWWKRYLSYVLLCVLVSAVVATVMFLYASGVLDRLIYGRSVGRYQLLQMESAFEKDPEGYNRKVIVETEAAGALAFLITAGFCTAQEVQVLKGKK